MQIPGIHHELHAHHQAASPELPHPGSRCRMLRAAGSPWPITAARTSSSTSTRAQPLPGCTTEACDFRDSLASLQGSGYEVLGISPDAPEALSAFAGDIALTFPLLADEDHAVALAYGAWGEKLVDGEVREGMVRSTVVVGPDGNVVLAQYQVRPQGHVGR